MSEWTAVMKALNSSVLGTFGREVTYVPSTGDPVAVRAIVDTAREAEEAVPGVYAVLFLQVSDLPRAPERGDEVEIDGATYKVFEVEADAAGGVKLALRVQ